LSKDNYFIEGKCELAIFTKKMLMRAHLCDICYKAGEIAKET